MDTASFLSTARSISDEITAHRRALHAEPETGFDLIKTKKYVKDTLTAMGCSPRDCGKAGVTATIGSGGKVIMLRADMDALPIKEETDLPFRSENGNMHACGHDMHTAMLLGAAKLLMMHKEELHGTVKLMFQPAEEMLVGAADMIADGVLAYPPVDAAMMIHVMTGTPMPAGTVVVSSPGISAPAADYFTINVRGKGCHGSTPQLGIDPLTAAAHILIALQEISAREMGTSDEGVITIGHLTSGNAGNVIPDSAVMDGTIRAFSEELREMIQRRIVEIAAGVGGAFRTQVEVSFGSGCPSLLNNGDLSDLAFRCCADLLGKDFVCTSGQFDSKTRGGSEDFAAVSRQVPSIMLALSAGEPKNGYTLPLHHPKVMFDESALPIGSAVYAWFALRWLENNK